MRPRLLSVLSEIKVGGQFRWFIYGVGSGRLLGRAEMLSRARRISSSYSCDTPCPPSFDRAWIEPDPTTVGVDEVEIQEALEIDVDGYGNEYGPFSANVVDWWSWDTSVATVYWGQVAGIAEGTTTTTATVEYPLYFWDSGTMDCTVVGTQQQNTSGQVQVDPTVRISAVNFSPTTIGQKNATTDLTVQISVSTGVPSGTQVLVEAFQNTNPNGVSFTISPANGQNGAQVSPGTVSTVEFQLTTTSTNSASGTVTYAARILSATAPPGSNVTVAIGTPNNVVSDQLTVQ